MASVRIHTGAISATDYVADLPQSDWPMLVGARRSFVQVKLPYDCRELLRFVAEAETMLEPLGYADIQDFVQRGLKLDPGMVAWAVAGLKAMAPEEEIPFDIAVAHGRLLMETARQVDPLKRVGGPNNLEGIGGKTHKQREDCQPYNVRIDSGPEYGNSQTYLLRRLKRDRPDLLEKIVSGEIKSARAAAIEAGIVRRYIQMPDDVDEIVKRTIKRYGKEAVRASVERMS